MSESPAMELDNEEILCQKDCVKHNQDKIEINTEYIGESTILNKENSKSNVEEISCEAKVQETDDTSVESEKMAKKTNIPPEAEELLSDTDITVSSAVESEITPDVDLTTAADIESTEVPTNVLSAVESEMTPDVDLTTAADIESTEVPTNVEKIVGADVTTGQVSPPSVEMAKSAELTVTAATEPDRVLSEVAESREEKETLSTDVQKDNSIGSAAGANEADIGNASSTVFLNAEGIIDQQAIQDQSKENYRTVEGSSDSESDSDSSSIFSVNSSVADNRHSNNGDSDAECDDTQSPSLNKKKGSYPVIKVKGEMQPEDLPPLEELHISVPSSLCAEIGVVSGIVKSLVVIQSHVGTPPLDIDSVLFVDNGSRSLGLIFDTFGPVNEPLYCVRFNSAEHINEFKVKPGDKVYFAPNTEHSKFVFLQQLLKLRGSDASWRNDIEPTVQIDFSDDEEERRAKKGSSTTVENEDNVKTRKREHPEDSPKRPRGLLDNRPQTPQQRNGQWRPRGGVARKGQFTPRPLYQGQPPQYSNSGNIRPPSFTVPDFSTPPPSVPRQPMPPQNSTMPDRRRENYYNYPPPASQGPFGSQPYLNPVQPTSSFGQLPYGSPQNQLDPRLIQIGTQFAQMMCALQAATPPVNIPPPPPPSFNMPYNQSGFPGSSQSNCNSFNSPPLQNQASYSLAQFSAPPPVAPAGPPHNLLPMNIPPPPGTSHGQTPQLNYSSNQHSSFDPHYTSSHSTSYRGRR